MLIFTDGSAQDNLGLTRSKQGLKSVPIKKVKTISRGASFEGELEAIFMGTEYIKDNPGSSSNNCHIYTDSQAAIKAIIGQSRESYHNTIRNIRENLMNICQTVDETKLVYCPAHKGMAENETSASKV